MCATQRRRPLSHPDPGWGRAKGADLDALLAQTRLTRDDLNNDQLQSTPATRVQGSCNLVTLVQHPKPWA